MSAKRGKYAEEFKRYAVWLTAEQGRPVRETARDLGLSASTLRRWTHELGVVPGPVAAVQETASGPSQVQLAGEEGLARPIAETERLLSELEACTRELAHVRASLAAARQEADALRSRWQDAREKLTALESEQRALEVELPTLVAERDAVQVTWEGQLTEARELLATVTAERDQMRRERAIRAHELAQSRQALNRAESELRSMQATAQAAGQKVAGLSSQNSRLQAAQKRQRALTLGSLAGGVLLLLLIAGQHVWMEGPVWDDALPPTELLALGARPSAEIERVGGADTDITAQHPTAGAIEATGTQTIDLAALEPEPDFGPFWLAALDESDADGSGGPGPAGAEAMPPAAAESEPVPWAESLPQEPAPTPAGSATGDAARRALEARQSPPGIPADEAAARHYRIQIGAYREQENVEWALREAQKLGVEPVATVPTGPAASRLTAVVVGDFASTCEACRAQCRLETLGWQGYIRRH
jgi:transposase-like protein/cell division septation protein DedD